MDRILFSVPEAAALLSVSRSTIYRLINEGTLSSVAIRGRIRVTRTDLDEFVASQARGAA